MVSEYTEKREYKTTRTQTMNTHAIGFTGLLIAALTLSGCQTLNSALSEEKLVKGCADSDLDSNAVLYFGPSNNLGPGSIWSRLGINGGYQPLWRAKEDLGVEASVIDLGKPFACEISRGSQLAANGGLSVLSLVANVSAEAKQDFSKAKSINISTTGAAWDTVIGGPYQTTLRNIDDADIRDDIAKPNRLIVRRASRLNGYKAILDFDTDEKAEIKAKYSGKILGRATVGEVGAQLFAAWTSDDKLQLTAMDGVYVAGEFAALVKGEWVSTKGSKSIPDLGDKWTKSYEKK